MRLMTRKWNFTAHSHRTNEKPADLQQSEPHATITEQEDRESNQKQDGMSELLVSDQADFEELCDHIRQAGIVAFDSEFISEYSYRPQLCLLQLATPARCVAIDPFEIEQLDSWWDVMADDATTIVVHGGQQEVRFCLTATGRRPANLIDVQIAEGLQSRSYPLAYGTLVQRVLGKKLHSKETRTDWRRRPLSEKQITYAMDDARYVLKTWERQRDSLSRLGRLEWVETECNRMIDDIETELSRESWRRISGLHKLNARELAVAIELADWREAEAEKLNRNPKRILRDDLLIDMARRQPKSEKELLATRDMNRGDYKRRSADFLRCIQRGLSVSDGELTRLPRMPRPDKNHDEQVVGKLLGLALANRCAELDLSMSLVGTTADLRDLVRWHVQEGRAGTAPRLACSWRAEVCGDLLEDVLDGKIAIRVADPTSDHPLVFDRLDV